MKKLIIIVMVIITTTTFAQTNPVCRFIPDQSLYDFNKYTNRFHSVIDTNEPIVINVKYQGMHETDGSDLHNINEERFLRCTGRLNEVYNPFNIFFKYRGYNFLNDSDYVNIGGNGQHTVEEMVQKIRDENLYDESSLNIFVNHGHASGGIGMVYLSTTHDDVISNGSSPFYDYMLPHEMGHTLGLLEIESGDFGAINIFNNLPSCIINPQYPAFYPYMKVPNLPGQVPVWRIENVTRDVNNINYNADTAGDLVVDTQACFYGYTANYCKNRPDLFPIFTDHTIFATHPAVVDLFGEMYNCTIVEGQNIMGVGATYVGFSPGQGARMRQHIISNTNIFSQKLNLLDDGTSDISVLYEPFIMGNGGSGNNYIATSAYSRTYTTNPSNTGANVWNCGPFIMRFQTGFNCEFYPYNGSMVNQSIYNQYNTVTSTSVGVKIPILGQQIFQNFAPVCFYSFEPFTSGDVKSLENLGSINYTQQELDEIKATDPELYEKLQSGKYHIITKQTDSGFVDQKIIYKN